MSTFLLSLGDYLKITDWANSYNMEIENKFNVEYFLKVYFFYRKQLTHLTQKSYDNCWTIVPLTNHHCPVFVPEAMTYWRQIIYLLNQDYKTFWKNKSMYPYSIIWMINIIQKLNPHFLTNSGHFMFTGLNFNSRIKN